MDNNNNVVDLLSVIGTVLGILNYNENLTQSKFQEEMEKDTTDLHRHLMEQDRKIDLILEALNDNRRNIQEDSKPSN